MQTTPSPDDALTIAAVGILAAVLAATAHETLGHGVTCLAVGGHVTLLTSIFFRCSSVSAWVDAAGPLGNAVATLLALGLLSSRRNWNATARLLLILLAGLNLFWFSGQLVYSGALNADDVMFAARGFGWNGVWRPASVMIGTVIYVAGIHLLAARMRDSIASRQLEADLHRRVVIAYAASLISACIAGLLWFGNPWSSLAEEALTFGVAPIGLLLATRRAQRMGPSGHVASLPIERSWPWILVGTAAFLIFALLQARGVGVQAS